MDEDDEDRTLPILTIRLELIENNVAFRPPLDQSSSVVSVQELVSRWLSGFVARGRLVKMLGPKVSCCFFIFFWGGGGSSSLSSSFSSCS